MVREQIETETTHRRVVAPAVQQSTVEQVDVVATDPYDERRAVADKAVQAVYLVFGLIEGLLAIRFILKLLGAGTQAAFTRFIYDVTWPFVAPFAGMFDTPTADGSVLELHTIVAFIVYALAGWLVARLVSLLLDDNRTAVHTTAHNVATHVDHHVR